MKNDTHARTARTGTGAEPFKCLEGDLAAVKEEGERLGMTRLAAESTVMSLCLDSLADEYLKLPFKDLSLYRMYFILKGMASSRADCLLVCLDANFMPLKTMSVESELFEDPSELATFIDENVPLGACSVIVSKFDPSLRFESELLFAGSLYKNLRKVNLHDYVLVTNGACRSVIGSFR